MTQIIPVSTLPLVPETLPALKARHYHDTPENRRVYCYARFYLLGDSLQLDACAFEREPAAGSCIGFALGQPGQAPHLISIGPDGAALRTLPPEGLAAWPMELPIGQALPMQPYGGSDEQGWYWGARLELPLHLCGSSPQPDPYPAHPGGLRCAVYKYTQGSPGWGSSSAGARIFDLREAAVYMPRSLAGM